VQAYIYAYIYSVYVCVYVKPPYALFVRAVSQNLAEKIDVVWEKICSDTL